MLGNQSAEILNVPKSDGEAESKQDAPDSAGSTAVPIRF